MLRKYLELALLKSNICNQIISRLNRCVIGHFFSVLFYFAIGIYCCLSSAHFYLLVILFAAQPGTCARLLTII